MSYDQYSVDQAKKKGLFNDNVFDPKALQLSDEEKQKLQKDLSKHPDAAETAGPEILTRKIQKAPDIKTFYVELNFFESIFLFFLSIFGKNIAMNYRLNKALKVIERTLTKNKPSVFNPGTQRVTKFFAYKIHDVYLKILMLKKVIENTLGDAESWGNPERIHKTGVELFFEKISNINTKEVESNFSYQGLGRIIADFESSKTAENAVERSINAYLTSIDKSTIETANNIYTNLIYIQNLADFDFISFFKRFDPEFRPGISPAFGDITLEALQPYLSDLEQSFLQIDLSIDNVQMFKALSDVGYFMSMLMEPSKIIEESRPENSNGNAIKNRENDFIVCFDAIKDIMTKNYLTLFLALIKKDPVYSPAIIHAKYDIFKIYCDTFKERASFITKFILKEKRIKKLETFIKKNFNSIQWAGIYNIETSGKIEEFDTIGFIYCYHLGIINTFLKTVYDDILKGIMNLTVTNGLFIEKYFQKTVSDTFYSMEKFQEKLRDFIFDINVEGVSGKKILNLLMKKEGNPVETKKTLDRNVSYENIKAKELFEEFYPNFSLITDIVSKLYNDIDTKPPKYLRNIRTIGGLKNPKYLNSLMRSYESLKSIKELFNLLKE